MTDLSKVTENRPVEQEAIRASCFHPTGTFVEFKKQDIEQSIPERFEQIVAHYPDRIAVKTKDQAISYDLLNNMANRVARALMARRGSEAEPVGLLFANGVPSVAAMLGVLKAGKFFVLLDSSSPKVRITGLLEDCQAGLVVTNQQNLSLASEFAGHRREVLNIDTLSSQLSNENIALSAAPGSLATIIYTSGSTGKPKGVIQNHRNILHYTMVRINELHICAHDRLSLLSSPTAGAIFITLAALLSGAALLPFDVQQEGATRLAPWLSQEDITICYIGSPLFRAFGATLTGKEKFPKLRLIRLASEAARASDLELYRKYFPSDCILVNSLSSSETGIVSKYLIDRKSQIVGSEVPVGYAVEDKEILLLDDSGREVGFNEVGEIAVKSRYLALGYYQEPELTKAKFRPDPEDSEKRLYLTGDLGLMTSEGCLVYKGRKDFRAKIRGYGVDTIEVERALLGHAAIKEVVVVVHANEAGEAALVAYFTSDDKRGPTVSELRRFLKEKLADYMIPSAFVMLDAMPLTHNGKVDRRALPVRDNSRPDLEIPFAAPQTSVDQKLAKIWAELLGIGQIGIHDNFFDLGGHSLLATRLISRVGAAFQIELPLRTIFEAPTVAGMAVQIVETKARMVFPQQLKDLLTDLDLLSNEETQRLLAQGIGDDDG